MFKIVRFLQICDQMCRQDSVESHSGAVMHWKHAMETWLPCLMDLVVASGCAALCDNNGLARANLVCDSKHGSQKALRWAA